MVSFMLSISISSHPSRTSHNSSSKSQTKSHHDGQKTKHSEHTSRRTSLSNLIRYTPTYSKNISHHKHQHQRQGSGCPPAYFVNESSAFLLNSRERRGNMFDIHPKDPVDGERRMSYGRGGAGNIRMLPVYLTSLHQYYNNSSNYIRLDY